MSLILASQETLEAAGLLGPDVSDKARLQIVFDDDRSLFFKPRQRYFHGNFMETQMVLDIDMSPRDLVDQILFHEMREEWNLEEILKVVNRDTYRRLCLVKLELYDRFGDNRHDMPEVGYELFVWSGSILASGATGFTLRRGHSVKEITPVLP